MVAKNVLAGLNDEQLLVANAIHGKVVVNATAGSGKTFTIVARTANMIEQGISAKDIVMFTFTRKAAEEMKARVEAKIGAKAKTMTVSTYHSFCVRLLRKYINTIGYRRGFSIYDEEDKISLLTEIFEKMKKADSNLKGIKVRDIACIISAWKENMLSFTDARKEADAIGNEEERVAATVYVEYSERMKECNALDFDDLIYMAIRILENNPTVLAEVNNRFRYIVADEAQDSGVRDFRLIQLLAGSDRNNWNLCLVGDDCQSIYSFRGANVSNYIRFIQENGFQVFNLSQNYRSTKTVVDASDSLVRKNTVRIEKPVFTENEQGEQIGVFTLDDDTLEAAQVTRIVRSCVAAGWSYDDIAVLYRTNNISRNVEESLLKNSIPYKVISGLPFYARKEIKDMMAYVRLVMNQNDQEAFRRVANVPKRGIGPASVDAILAYVNNHAEADIFDACESVKLRSRKAQLGINNFVSVIEQLYETAAIIQSNGDGNRTMADLIRQIVILTDYENHLRETEKDEEAVDNRMANIRELLNMAREYNNIEEFVENMMGFSSEDEEDEEGNASVKLLTMHASKGLEWPIVIIIGCSEGIAPHFLAARDGNIEEERRLMYVAMTRAREQLFLTRAKYVKDRGGSLHATQESRFISEINGRFLRKR